MQAALQSPSKKEWLKFIQRIDAPYLCEALIIELEGRKNKLNPDFKSGTPVGKPE